MSIISTFVLGNDSHRQGYLSTPAITSGRLGTFLDEAMGTVVEHSAASKSSDRRPSAVNVKDSDPSSQPGQVHTAVMSKVLIVVDDVESCESFAQVLSGAGHSVRLVYSSTEIFRELLNFIPDIVLFDMNVPSIPNMLTLSIVWRMSELTRTRIVICTQRSQINGTQQVNWHADSILAKPISPDQLLETVANLNSPSKHKHH